MDRSASRNRPAGGRPPQDWCGRAVLYSLTQRSSACCRPASVAYWPSAARKNSARMVLRSRPALPVVAGEYGLASRCLMPLPAQIRAGQDRPGPRPDRAVKTLPLPVRICSGTPRRRTAPPSARHTGRAVARSTAFAHTMHREWSSMPVTTLTSVPPARRTRPITPICHSCIARPRLPAPAVLPPPLALLRVHQAVPDQRPVHRRPGPAAAPPRARSSSRQIRDGPHPR